MKKNLLLLFILSIILAACNNIDPVTYNDNLVQYSNDADARIDLFHKKLDVIISNDDFSQIKDIERETIDSINVDLAKINNLKQPSGAESFHNATLSYVESLIPYVKEISNVYTKINNEIEVDDNSYSNIERTDSIREAKLNDMIETQKSFAKAKGFGLE